MGGEGAQWIGMAPFMKQRRHLLQNIGDGTFHHSGSLAVRAAVASGANITFKLLYNSAVAMTGGQQPTGVMPVPALTRTLLAEGVRRVIVTTEQVSRYRSARLGPQVEVWHRDRIVEAQSKLSHVPGVTVLIHDQECATELRRKRKRGLAPDPVERIMINERICEGCGDCGVTSNCLSVQPTDTEFGRKTVIDQSSCNKDYSCTAGDCPSFVSVVPGRKTGNRGRKQAPSLESDEIPDPPGATIPATHTTRITGVGGSGVVTLAQVLTAAAMLAGRDVRTLDQTGLAQKGGAVVSDIKIAATAVSQSNKASTGECDLYLGCDLLVAADARNLGVAAPDRTVAIVSTSKVPTGAMVTDTGTMFPDVATVTERIKDATLAAGSVFLDARYLSLTLLGSDQFANLFLTGVAYQNGTLPLPGKAIEEAIELNGVQVRQNLKAFRWGRQYVASPDEFASAVAALTPASRPHVLTSAERALMDEVGAVPGSELARLLTVRVPDLVAYQGLGYARDYARFVARVRDAERAVAPGAELSEAVARSLYKLMAYKDEYEVARLALDPMARAAVRAEFGPDAKEYHLLHPPILRALGMKRKIRLGPWFRPGFAVLRAMKPLRGTPFDPFGRTRVRRTERGLIAEYRIMIGGALDGLSVETHARAVELAALPDMIRGYEEIKLANVEKYRARAAELLPARSVAVRLRMAPANSAKRETPARRPLTIFNSWGYRRASNPPLLRCRFALWTSTLTLPSTTPELQGRVRPLRTAW
jgi:indolepyruvate ferredoxin oxidoreductase